LRPSRMFAVVCGLAGTAALAAVLTAPLALAGEGSTGSAHALSVRTALRLATGKGRPDADRRISEGGR
jgi:hypothetical protein